jgi:hydroxymethylbilane synthase
MVDRQGPGQLSPPPRLRIATRQSRLALWQANHVQALLLAHHPTADLSLVGMTTRGDRILDRPLADVGGKGLFIKELETALLDGRAEQAVHSLKDVPMDMPEGFVIAAVLEREDPRDAFVSNAHASLDELPEGAMVGTSSLRRSVQILDRRPDLKIAPLRGNVDTRLARLDNGDYAAIILAAAGLKRLGLAARIRATIPPDRMLPAAGQGAIAIEVLAADGDARDHVAVLDDEPTRLAVTAERAAARRVAGSCHAPFAAHARFVEGGLLRLEALIADDAGVVHRADGEARVLTDADADAFGQAVAARLPVAG